MSSVASPAAVAGRPLQLRVGGSAAARTAGGPGRSRSASRCSGSPPPAHTRRPTLSAAALRRSCSPRPGAAPPGTLGSRATPRSDAAAVDAAEGLGPGGPDNSGPQRRSPTLGFHPGEGIRPPPNTSHPLMAAGVRDESLALSAESPHGNRRPSDHRWSSVPRHTTQPPAGRATNAGGRRSAPWWCGWRLAGARWWGLVGGGGLVFVALVQLVGLALAVDTGRR
jgi:hypothetical protein